MDKYYEKIISISNIREAYFELVKKLDEGNKSKRYSGIDGVLLEDIEANSEEVFVEIQNELQNLTKVNHVVQYSIPKTSGNGCRDIFIYTIKERIKAQAIYRVVEPVFEETYSDFLFSYRSTKPSYFAARSAVRRYKRRFGEDNLLLIDFASYSDYIDHNILVEKLEKLGFSSEVMELFKLFIFVDVFNQDRKIDRSFGLMQGVPLIALFANLYLNDLDHSVGKRVQFYRRVGDDLLIADPNKEKLDQIFEEIVELSKTHRLQIKKEKTKQIKNTEEFNFLGYTLKDKTVSIKQSGVKRILARWQKQLAYNEKSEAQKLRNLKTMFTKEEGNLDIEFKQIVSQYMFADNDKQMKWLQNEFIKLVVRYFFKTYSERNHRKTLELITPLNLPSLYKYFIDLHNGKKI